jgi:hypothetical protein
VVGVSPAPAQGGQGERPQQAPEQPELAQPRVQIVDYTKIVGTAVVNRGDGDSLETIGEVSDLVLDERTGAVCHAVVAGRAANPRAVPWSALTWDPRESHFTLSMTAAMLGELPAFDPKNLQQLAPKDDGGKAGDQAGAAKNAARVEASSKAVAIEQPAVSYLIASKVLDGTVMTGNDELGAAETLFVERKTGSAAFLTVATGGFVGIGETEYVLPWKAVRVVEPAGDDELQLHLGKQKDAMAKAPKIGDEGADLNKSEFREQVYAFYGVDRPAFEPKAAKPGDGEDTFRRVPVKKQR